ncbi:pirin family protein [Williamsia sp. CHRR-6]|uniref:pirin family protein n=1 Tax=Williamsia sp. CHRR-6 TaxID=2835871 RepID=UPI001BDAA4A7|nr:pirin family protein [Williamsia sp. CHRR-6]MBT0566987.1 pirin family protein [Williamsia sp. CHRR-6]
MHTRLIRSHERRRWSDGAITSWQSFPATGSFDLAANAFGVLMVHNDDLVDAGAGFDTHQHRNAEIVTWVLAGAIEHRDSQGNCGLITPGVVQRMTAGRGITHSERNASPRAEHLTAHVIQMWLPPDVDELDPGYAEADVTARLVGGDLVPVVSGRAVHHGSGAIAIANRFVALHIARLQPGRPVTLTPAPFGHLFVAQGSATVIGTEFDAPLDLSVGDAVRFTDLDDHVAVSTSEQAEILFWEMHASFDL